MAAGVAVICSAIAMMCLLIHYVFRVKGEAWPAVSPRFRVFLSAGSLIALNILSVPVFFVFVLPESSEEFRQWLDSIVLFTWLPVSILIFLVLYFALKVVIPRTAASTVGRSLMIFWAFVTGALSILIVVPFAYVLIIAINQP